MRGEERRGARTPLQEHTERGGEGDGGRGRELATLRTDDSAMRYDSMRYDSMRYGAVQCGAVRCGALAGERRGKRQRNSHPGKHPTRQLRV